MTNSIKVVGNLAGDPELRFTPSGQPVANFSIAETPRKFDRQTQQWVDAGETNFFRCTAWGDKALNISESLSKGDRVIVNGKLSTEKFTDRDGRPQTSTNNLTIDEIGPDLSFATAKPGKVNRKNEGGGGGNQGGGGYNGGQGGYGGGNQGGNSGGYGGGNQGGGGGYSSDEPPF